MDILSGVKQDKGEGGSFEPVSGVPPRLGFGEIFDLRAPTHTNLGRRC